MTAAPAPQPPRPDDRDQHAETAERNVREWIAGYAFWTGDHVYREPHPIAEHEDYFGARHQLHARDIHRLVADHRWLLNRLAEVCDDHAACIACEADLCTTCQVGEPSDCDHHLGTVCKDCQYDYCPTCAREVTPTRGVGVGAWSR